MTTVINIRQAPSGFKKTDGVQFDQYVYIGRPGLFGNPISLYGKCPVCGQYHKTAGSTLECYRIYLLRRCASDIAFKDAVIGLRGKILVCYCKPNACHGDILAVVAYEL